MIPPESFLLDRTEGTLQSRIQQMVAQGILSGRFRPGERLPSSRKLAQHLGVSRITVTLAYTELVADDYLTARGRSGYYVSDNAPEPPNFTPQPPQASTVNWSARLGSSPPSLGINKPQDWQKYRYNFIYGQSDPSLFDSANWRLCALQALGKKDFDSLTSDQFDQDDPLLIDFITRQTLPRRGILAAPDEVLLTLGAQNALWLTAQLLLAAGKTAVIEDPCYPSIRSIVQATGAEVSAVPVDAEGLPPEAIPGGASVVFTTPSHQCPTTTTMPLSRRRALLDRAEADDFIVVEDDYDFEMTFAGPAAPALKSLDQTGRVIHVGSFSKSIFPGLRLGYLVGPAPFIAAARALRASVLRHPPGHIQRTTAYFLSLGHYDALIRRMSKAYHTRRQTLDAAIALHGLTVAGSNAYGGSSVWMRAPGIDTTALAETLRAKGVLIEPGAPFFASSGRTDLQPSEFYRLAYSSTPTSRISDGIATLAMTIRSAPVLF
ncbi:MocR-like pyridoxine biosynthesis transcription factor PdxR [Flavimaricola marinus]|uniref:HTH-type transcriptional regulatory protein GabR n=1 Tax=Flavimaricola marinus TaxID=1819565 RepID=A0A238LAE7_9RHOB|nr:PLP-dependent aminotransferase family protein [Flavimaricola marinus]SMY06697.1 HTH-type transcriptional regulatory protein GabR [Flavimaricola marinus]